MGRRARKANWDSPELAAEYAITRWGQAAGDKYRNWTWRQFADFIQSTGDYDAANVAATVRELPGKPIDFPLRVDPISTKDVSRRGLQLHVMHMDTIGRNEHKYVIAATEGGEVVGRMDFTVLDDTAHVDWIEITDPKNRRRGIARAMYIRLYQWAGDENLTVEHGMLTDEGNKTLQSLRPELERIRMKRSLMAEP